MASGNSAHAVLWRECDADADVLGNADLALYRAKAGGRNTFCFFNANIEKATLAATGIVVMILSGAVAICASYLHLWDMH